MINSNTNGNNGNGFASRWWSSLRWRRSRPSDQDLAPYRRLAVQLHYELPRPESQRSVLLATPAETLLCANGSIALAGCLAEELCRPVLLVDASPRESEVSHLLDCAARRGFSDFWADPKLPLEELVLPTTQPNLCFLPAGTAVGTSHAAPAEDLAAWLGALESRYDFVLLAGGSVLHNSMALVLAPYVGCVLLLVMEDETRLDDLEAAQDALSFCKARKVGLLLTSPVRVV